MKDAFWRGPHRPALARGGPLISPRRLGRREIAFQRLTRLHTLRSLAPSRFFGVRRS
ncbi:hypothetical protein [Pseudomonas sp. Z4-20]|uniref:hypothetical protein n=1 Tax=Pseudomonas sp. Z4-20 TaxID=2817414 RepID=UPI003DA9DD1D